MFWCDWSESKRRLACVQWRNWSECRQTLPPQECQVRHRPQIRRNQKYIVTNPSGRIRSPSRKRSTLIWHLALLSDAGLRRPRTKLLYLNHRLPPTLPDYTALHRASLIFSNLYRNRAPRSRVAPASGSMFVFRSVKNTDVFPAASTDGFTAVRKTNAIHFQGSP